MTDASKTFGLTDTQLATEPLTFRDGLFKYQVVLVTGGGRGIGKAIAVQFARLGAKLAITGRNEERLAKSKALIESVGGEAIAIPMSIRDPELCQRTVADVMARYGRIDHLINNAGGQFPQAAIDFKPKGWNAVIDTNLNGTWYMMQAVAKHWHATKQPGSIVTIVAVVGRGMPGMAHTAAARAGVIALSKTVATEWAPYGIRVNCVAPGIIESDGMYNYDAATVARYPGMNAMRRMGTVRDVADAVCYLAGPSGAFITGDVVTIDGGGQVWGEFWAVPRPPWFEGK